MRFSILITDDAGSDHMFDSEVDPISAGRVIEAIDGCKELLIPGEMLQLISRSILQIVDITDIKTYKIPPRVEAPAAVA